MVLLVVAQLVLPGIAAQRVRDQLARSGQVLSVQVHAFPAIELLWHHADRVVIRLGRYRTPAGKLGSSLGQSGDVGSLDATATEVDTGLLALHDAHLAKRGNHLTASATVTDADLHAALPILQSVTPVASTVGQLVAAGHGEPVRRHARPSRRSSTPSPGASSSRPTSPSAASPRSPSSPIPTSSSRAWGRRPWPADSPFTGRRWFTEADDHLYDRPRRRVGSRRSPAADARLLRLLFRLAIRSRTCWACRALLIADPEREGVQFLARGDDGASGGLRLAVLDVGHDRGREDRRHERPVRRRGCARRRGRHGADRGLPAAARERGARVLAWQTALDNTRAQSVYDRIGAERAQWLDYSLTVGLGRVRARKSAV